jgi:hypothetical protein
MAMSLGRSATSGNALRICLSNVTNGSRRLRASATNRVSTTGSARSARVSRWAPTASEGGLRNRGGDDLRQALRLASILSVVTILGGTLRTVSVAMSRLAASNMLAAASPPDTPLHDVTPGDVGYTAIAPGAGGVEQFELAKQARSPMLVGCLSILCSHASSYQFAPRFF